MQDRASRSGIKGILDTHGAIIMIVNWVVTQALAGVYLSVE